MKLVSESLNQFKLNEVQDIDYGFELKNIWDEVKDIPFEEIQKTYFEDLGKSGELLRYMKVRGYELNFGILKALFKDAISYKKKREFIKGGYKFIHRAIPIAIGPIFLPIMVLNYILGATRAFDKIIIPVLTHTKKEDSYKNFLKKLLITSFDVIYTHVAPFAEGEIKKYMEKDWYYNIFYMDKGLINMIRKEHLFEFATYLADKMSKEQDEKIVPNYYIENEFRKWLNNKFKIYPKLPLQKKPDKINQI